MIRHIKQTRCSKYLNPESQQQLQLSPSGVSNYKFSQDKSREDLVDMIIMHAYPFHMVEHKGFLKFLKNLRPQFKLICEKTISADCKIRVEELTTKIRIMIQEAPGHLSFTTDLWTSNQNLGYMAVTCMYFFYHVFIFSSHLIICFY